MHPLVPSATYIDFVPFVDLQHPHFMAPLSAFVGSTSGNGKAHHRPKVLHVQVVLERFYHLVEFVDIMLVMHSDEGCPLLHFQGWFA